MLPLLYASFNLRILCLKVPTSKSFEVGNGAFCRPNMSPDGQNIDSTQKYKPSFSKTSEEHKFDFF